MSAELNAYPSVVDGIEPPSSLKPAREEVLILDEESKKPKEAQGQKVYEEIRRRHRLGYGAAILGTVVTLGTLVWSAYHVHTPLDQLKNVSPGSPVERAVFVAIGAHTVVTVAAIYFGYTLIRLAERMFLPQHLLHDERNVAVVRALLGVSTPAQAAANGAKEVAESLTAVAKPMVELTKPLVEIAKAAGGTEKK